MRICLVYDCLFPHTVGGAERWYYDLARRLAERGHEVTYLTLRQWDDKPQAPPGVEVVAVGPRLALYTPEGRRRIVPPLVFGTGVLAHLGRFGKRYDVLHTASFPYFSLLAAGGARLLGRYRLFVDWHEVWTREYWRAYVGLLGGAVGWRVQRLCMRVPHVAFCPSRLHERRLRQDGFRGEIRVLRGRYDGGADPRAPHPSEAVVVFAGRLIPEKRALALVPALAVARQSIPGLRAELYGDGPQREALLGLIDELGLEEVVEAPGFVGEEQVQDAIRRALCLVLPSVREGYGLVVVEASAKGTPSVVARAPDNAATELVDEGENGFIAASAAPEDIAHALVRVHAAGPDLRERTADWYRRHARELSLEASLETVLSAYAAD